MPHEWPANGPMLGGLIIAVYAAIAAHIVPYVACDAANERVNRLLSCIAELL